MKERRRGTTTRVTGGENDAVLGAEAKEVVGKKVTMVSKEQETEKIREFGTAITEETESEKSKDVGIEQEKEVRTENNGKMKREVKKDSTVHKIRTGPGAAKARGVTGDKNAKICDEEICLNSKHIIPQSRRRV